MHKYVEQLPDNQGWRSAGYDFRVDDNGLLTIGISGAPALHQVSAIENGQIINGVANFWQTSAPTARVGGAALVEGDLWHKPTDNGILGTAGDWIWRSPYWLSTTPRRAAGDFANTSANTYATSTTRVDVEVALGTFLVESIRYRSNIPLNVNDENNYWGLYLRPDSGSLISLATTLNLTFDSTVRTREVNVAPAGGFSVWSRGGLGIYASKLGSPSNLSGFFSATIRDIHP